MKEWNNQIPKRCIYSSAIAQERLQQDYTDGKHGVFRRLQKLAYVSAEVEA